jgi:hypothetical protein
MKTMTFAEAIDFLTPDNEVDVEFPEGFILEASEYNWRTGETEKVKFECCRLNVYFWPEEDHWGRVYYYYTPGRDQWFTKYISSESEKKVKEYLETHEITYQF